MKVLIHLSNGNQVTATDNEDKLSNDQLKEANDSFHELLDSETFKIWNNDTKEYWSFNTANVAYISVSN